MNNLLFLTNYSAFSSKHIIILIVCVLAIVLGGIFSTKLSLKQIVKILLIIGICSETIKLGYYILDNEATLHGYLPKTDLPFHLCSIQLIFILILNISSNEKLKRLFMGFMIPTCLIGGFAALCLPTYSSLNGKWILGLQYFGYHVAICVFAIYLLRQKEIKWTFKDYTNTLLLLFGIGIAAIYINSILYTPDFVFNPDTGLYEAEKLKSINFMYVVYAPADNLPFLNTDHGWLPYICHYAFTAFVAISCCYIKPIINKIKKVEE